MKIKESIEIVFGEGFNEINFGMTIEQVVLCLGVPDAIVSGEENGDIAIYYNEHGLFLWFDQKSDYLLSIIEIEATANCLLWNQPIFNLNMKQVLALFQLNGYFLKKHSEDLFNEEIYYYNSEKGVSIWFNKLDRNKRISSIVYNKLAS